MLRSPGAMRVRGPPAIADRGSRTLNRRFMSLVSGRRDAASLGAGSRVSGFSGPVEAASLGAGARVSGFEVQGNREGFLGVRRGRVSGLGADGPAGRNQSTGRRFFRCAKRYPSEIRIAAACDPAPASGLGCAPSPSRPLPRGTENRRHEVEPSEGGVVHDVRRNGKVVCALPDRRSIPPYRTYTGIVSLGFSLS
jgi:hypothetical protein